MRKPLLLSATIAAILTLLPHSASMQGSPAAPPEGSVRQSGQSVGSIARVGTRRPEPSKGPIPRLPNGRVILGDVAWRGGGSAGDDGMGNIGEQGGMKKGELESLMLPWAKELMASRYVAQDPHNYCLPDLIPRATAGFPFRFVQNDVPGGPTHMFIVQEGNIHSFRQIFMDGRKHPDMDPTWYGHSIGSWDKDTLVIDTVGFNDKAWWDGMGHPHTEKLHVIERWTRLDAGHMENKVTIDDPGAYTKPWTVTFMATAKPGDEIMEYICQENNQYGNRLTPASKK